jgi:hypothetical protein
MWVGGGGGSIDKKPNLENVVLQFVKVHQGLPYLFKGTVQRDLFG